MNSKGISYRTLLLWLLMLPWLAYGHDHDRNVFQLKENKGQWEQQVLFQTTIDNGLLFLEKHGFTYGMYDMSVVQDVHTGVITEDLENLKIPAHGVHMEFFNASEGVEVSGTDAQKGYSNYFIGNDSSKWTNHVASFSGVHYSQLYNGIDLNFYQKDGQLKYDYVVAPSGNVNEIKVVYNGADDISIIDGALIIATTVNEIIEEKPFAYQLVNGRKFPVECRYELSMDSVVSFSLPNGYDNSIELIIDPTLMFSSLSGSFANNFGYTATFDDNGFLYSGSSAFGQGYPVTTGSYNVLFAGGTVDVAISKFDSSGTSIIYSTYLGGTKDEVPHSLIVNSQDELYVMGTTGSNDFPMTLLAFQDTFSGGTSETPLGLGLSFVEGIDIFVAQLSSGGDALLSSTYLGGSGNDGFNSVDSLMYNYADQIRGEIMINDNDEIFIVSCTQSLDFPVTSGAFQDGYQGGEQDGFVCKINAGLSNLIWSTYLGGEEVDAVYSVAVDDGGDIYVTGGTKSVAFPVTQNVADSAYNGGRCDGFITHLSGGSGLLLASTFIGSGAYDQFYFVELDHLGNVYVLGQTEAPDSTFIFNALYGTPNSGQLVLKIKSSLDSIRWSTVFGTGSGAPNISPTAFLVDLCDAVYISGWGGTVNTYWFLNNNAGFVSGMDITADAEQVTTDGSDFYLMVLEDDASALIYGSYFGGGASNEHVDGGTSRFDRKGKIYQAVCAGCGGASDFPIEPASSPMNVNNNSCNLGVFKMDFNLPLIVADFDVLPTDGCAPFNLQFIDLSKTQGNTYYFWDFGDNSPIDTTVSPMHTYADTGTYNVKLLIIDTFSCNLLDSIMMDVFVWVRPPVVANFSATDTLICDSMVFTGQNTSTGLDLVYSWNFGDGSAIDTSVNVLHTYNNSGAYVILLTVIDTVCNLAEQHDTILAFLFQFPVVADFTFDSIPNCDSMIITTQNNSLGDNLVYSWDLGNGTTTNLAEPFWTYYTEDDYVISLIVTDTACNFIDTIERLYSFNFDFPLVAIIAADDSVDCGVLYYEFEDQSIGGAAQVDWTFGNGEVGTGSPVVAVYPDTGIYTVQMIVSDPNCGFKDTALFVVNFNDSIDLVVADFTTVQPNVCDLSLQTINLSTGSSGLQYFWDISGTIYSGEEILHTFSSTGTYSIKLIAYDDVCDIADTIVYNVDISGIVIDLNLEEEVILCEEDTVLLEGPDGFDAYLWSNGVFGQSIDVVLPGSYWLQVSLDICSKKDTVVVSPAPPMVELSEHQLLCAGDAAYLTPEIPSATFLWSTGETSSSIIVNDLGEYWFDVTDDFGCTWRDTVTVELNEKSTEVYVPNCFTPEGNNLNEVFMPKAESIEQFKMSVFDRWGELVFSSNNVDEGWDGRIKDTGLMGSTDVYVYVIEYFNECATETNQRIIGHVVLLK